MSDPKIEPDDHQAVWSPNPQVDLAKLDDQRLRDYRHPDERQALIAIAVVFTLLLLALAIAHPQAADFLRWLPAGVARTVVEWLHPTRAGPIIILALALFTATDALGLSLKLYDLHHEAVEVNPATFPQLAPVVDELRRRFALPRTRVYASRGAPLAGTAFGVREPYAIVLSTVLLGTLTPDEFTFVLGRQMGHIKVGHTRMALIFGSGQVPLSFRLLQQIRALLFGNYLRAQELSADRIGLLATRDLRPVLSLITKLEIGTVHGARIDLDSLTPQAVGVAHGRSAVAARIREIASTHPRLILRLLELTRWAGLPPEQPAATSAQTTPAAAAPGASPGPSPATDGAGPPGAGASF